MSFVPYSIRPSTQLAYRDKPEPQNNLEAKVKTLVDKYKDITTLHPTLEQFTKTPEYWALFTKVFTHHVRLIKSRPQELERGYITVYDSALVKLTSDGHEMANRGAIALFVEQILGIKKADSVEDLGIMLKGNLAMRTTLLEGVEACEKKRQGTASLATERSLPAREKVEDREPAHDHVQQQHQFQPDDAHIERLLRTFNDAEYDYRSTRDTDAARKKDTIKFLRDSAENALEYLRASHPGHQMIPKLQETFQMAQAKCIWLNGGRKRPFEMSGREFAKRARQNFEFRKTVRADRYRPSEYDGTY